MKTADCSRRTLMLLCAFGAFTAMFCGAAFPQTGEIKIGGLTFLTGKFSSYGADIEKGVKLALDKVNAKGGVLGKKLVVDLQDTASDSAQAVSLLRRFASSSDVAAIIGPTGTPDLLAIIPVARQLTVPVVTIGSMKPMAKDEFPDQVFRVTLMNSPEVVRDIITKVAAAKNIKRIGLLMDRTNDAQQADARSARDAIKLGAGVQLVADESYAGGDKDFSVLIGKMMQANADALWLSATTNEAAIIILQARARGFKGVVMGGAGMTDPKIVQLVGAGAAPYVMFTPLNLESDRPIVRDFVEAYRKAYGNNQIATFSAYAYDSVMLVEDAIRRAGSADRKAVAQAIGSTKSFPGVAGEYSYDGKGDNVKPVPYIMEVGPKGAFVSFK
ncbi:MAG: ABC transporter substrate-binding protein [Burkholderiales bacterium]